jgi:hypothetical protein
VSVSSIHHRDVLDLLEEGPRTAKSIAVELLAPWQTIATILNRALDRGHAVMVAPTPDHPVVRYALSDAEVDGRRQWRERIVLPASMRRQELARMGALGTNRIGRAR